MTKTRKKKLITIILLTIAICGMSIGMAAFSATLSISSSANVTPNSDDFNIKVYGFSESKTAGELNANFDFNLLSDTVGMPTIYNGEGNTALPATISNNKNSIKISNIQVQYTNNLSSSTEYYFVITNEGKYNATLSYSEFQKYFENSYDKNCVYDETINYTLANQVCENIKMYIVLGNIEARETILNSTSTDSIVDFNSSYIFAPGSSLFLCIGIKSSDSSVLPDGDMQINFEDLELIFTTTPPSEN